MITQAPTELFFSKKDASDLRLGELVKATSPGSAEWLLLGYPDDEGIKNNGGRVGAAQGPNKIRELLYRMTPSAFSKVKLSLSDVGNLEIGSKLFDTHENAKNYVSQKLSAKKRMITLGGGHDYGYPDGAAFLQAFAKSKIKPLIINFDSHLDVRPLKDINRINSGTPFFRLLSEFAGRFEFLEVGLQPQCNSPSHLEWLKSKKGKFISITEIGQNGLLSSLKKKVKAQKKRPLFISLDIDALSTTCAPGASQGWPSGIYMREMQEALLWLQKNFDLKLFSIYEVSPPLDIDNITAKTAATLIHRILFRETL